MSHICFALGNVEATFLHANHDVHLKAWVRYLQQSSLLTVNLMVLSEPQEVGKDFTITCDSQFAKESLSCLVDNAYKALQPFQ